MAAKKNALGRGLGALIDDAGEEVVRQQQQAVQSTSPISEIKLSNIEVNPFQPRTEFDQEALNELANSIKELGIIQPITLRELSKNKYQLISGERRFRASKIAGLEKITAYVRKANDQEMLEMALVENIQREDLDAIEISISYQRLMDECKLTQETLSTRVGKKRSTVTNYLRLLKLPAEVQLGIRHRKLSMGHARTLVSIEDKDLQIKLCDQIIEEELSVRKAEELVRSLSSKTNGKEVPQNGSEVLPDQYSKLGDHLSQKFDANIDFKINNKGRGKIVIPFKSNADLERIIGIIDQLDAK